MNLQYFVSIAWTICLFSPCYSIIEVSVIPDGSLFPTEGTKFVVKCTVVDPSGGGAPEAFFADVTNIAYDANSSPRLTLTKNKDNATSTTVVTMIWDPIEIADITEKRRQSQCRLTNRGHTFTIVVVPKVSVPTVSVSPTNDVSAKKGAETLFTCQVSTVITGMVESIELQWSTELRSKKLPENAKEINKESNLTHVSSGLVISNVDETNAMKYYCSAILSFIKASKSDPVKGDMYNKFVEVAEVTYNAGMEDSKIEVESKAGETKEMDCNILGSPTPKLTWMKDEDVITSKSDSRYKFSNKSASDPAKRFFQLADITYTDRAVYKCIAARKGGDVEKEFALRVRDPLGALWPFIGIVVEAIVLVIIIFLFECYKKNKKSKAGVDERDGIDNEELKETSPLVAQTPKVSYQAGDDGVRARMSTEATA